jgi:hypothetical protein
MLKDLPMIQEAQSGNPWLSVEGQQGCVHFTKRITVKGRGKILIAVYSMGTGETIASYKSILLQKQEIKQNVSTKRSVCYFERYMFRPWLIIIRRVHV